LRCQAPEVKILDEKGEEVQPVELMKAQAAVRGELQKDWFDLYVQYVTGQRRKSKIKTPKEALSQWNADRRVCSSQTTTCIS